MEEQTQPQQKESLRFNLNQETKILKHLSKKFEYASEPITEEVALSEEFLIISSCHVIGIEPLSEQAKRLLSRFCEKESRHKVPSMDYSLNRTESPTGLYSPDYMLWIMGFMALTSPSVQLMIKSDYPATVTDGTHFKILLAPRAGGD